MWRKGFYDKLSMRYDVLITEPFGGGSVADADFSNQSSKWDSVGRVSMW